MSSFPSADHNLDCVIRLGAKGALTSGTRSQALLSAIPEIAHPNRKSVGRKPRDHCERCLMVDLQAAREIRSHKQELQSWDGPLRITARGGR